MPRQFRWAAHRATNRTPIRTLSEYIRLIEAVTGWWGPVDFWFRGVSRSSGDDLRPSLYRSRAWREHRRRERALTDEFVRRGPGFLTDRRRILSRAEWYQEMRHRGLPTRLLDWTTGGLVALHFALADPLRDRPSVYVLDPLWLNEVSTKRRLMYYSDPTIASFEDAIVDDYLCGHEDEGTARLPRLPIAISPGFINQRIRAQLACFTVHGRTRDGIVAACRSVKRPRLVQLRIATSRARNIREELTMAGITETVVFPDLDALARELRHQYGFDS